MAYNSYYPHSQAPSPMQQQQQPQQHAPEAPSTIFSMGSPAFAKASDIFGK